MTDTSPHDYKQPTKYNAYSALDNFLFEDVINNQIRGQMADHWEVTFQGDNYVVRHWDTGTDYHFRVLIEPFEWDSEQVRKDQEWD